VVHPGVRQTLKSRRVSPAIFGAGVSCGPGMKFIGHVFNASTHRVLHHKSPSDFARALTNGPTLASWMTLTAPLPAKHKNALLTREYTVLSSSVSTSSQAGPYPHTAAAIFSIRTYALRCLSHTTLKTVDPDTLWDHATKFAGVFVKASGSPPEGETTRIMLSTFLDLVRDMEGNRVGEVFLKGAGFVRFCGYWMGFAKRGCVLFFCFFV
jgi:separase